MPSRGCGRGHPQQARGRRATSDEWCEIDGQRRWWWGRFEMRNNVRTEQRGDGESVCFRKQDDSWFSSAVRARKQQSWRATWLWGKGTGPGAIYCPRAIWHPGWLLQCALPRGLAHTPDQGQRLGPDGDDQGCPSPGYRGFLAPLRQGQGHRRKVCGTRSGVVALFARGEGGPDTSTPPTASATGGLAP